MAALLLTAVFSTCGKRKPPRAPVERVIQRVEINGQQMGDRIDLAWRMPARNAGSGSTLRISRVDVYRLVEKLNDPLSLTEEEFASRSTLIGSIKVDDSDFSLKTKIYSDKLQIFGQKVRLRYAIRFANESGQKAAFSNFFLIEPASNVALAPADVKAIVSQDAIKLEWTPPVSNLDGTTPANIIGYNIYRVTAGGTPGLLNKNPHTASEFNDPDFSFGEKYLYFVRTVSLGRNAESVESFGSETVEASPLDTFKPAAPDALTVASAPSVISLFFAFNLEDDVVGYKVYRSTDPNRPKAEWDLVTREPMKTNTFQDRDVVANVVYYYYVVALDNAGNVSAPSIVVSDTAL
ncbi:MAG: fibronectin type III domain-containing protein [Pyrinomonadaceae bacterium]|nr:fibronectin type III domain-containing protein [Pyrinomonadaceae bacterium]